MEHTGKCGHHGAICTLLKCNFVDARCKHELVTKVLSSGKVKQHRGQAQLMAMSLLILSSKKGEHADAVMHKDCKHSITWWGRGGQ